MLAGRRVVVPLVALLGLIGAGAAVWLSRAEAPLAPLAVETLAPPTGIELPHHVEGGSGDGTAFSFDSPVEGSDDDGPVLVELAGLPRWSTFGVSSVSVEQYGTAEEFTDWQRRNPVDSQLVGDVVLEHSALGAAYRKDLEMTGAVTVTQWTVQRDGELYLVEWAHHPDDARWRPTVEAMLDSWRWG